MCKDNNDENCDGMLENLIQNDESNSIFFITGEIRDETSQTIGSIYANPPDTDSIFFLINSLGGSASDEFLCYSFMEEIKKEHNIYTICYGHACSAAALILANGTKGKRYATDYACITVHRISEDQDAPESSERLWKNKYLYFLSKACGRTIRDMKQITERINYFSAKEAKEFGLIDKIIPCLKIPKLLKA